MKHGDLQGGQIHEIQYNQASHAVTTIWNKAGQIILLDGPDQTRRPMVADSCDKPKTDISATESATFWYVLIANGSSSIGV